MALRVFVEKVCRLRVRLGVAGVDAIPCAAHPTAAHSAADAGATSVHRGAALLHPIGLRLGQRAILDRLVQGRAARVRDQRRDLLSRVPLGGGRIEVGLVDPLSMLGVIPSPDLQPVADEAAARLKRVSETLSKLSG